MSWSLISGLVLLLVPAAPLVAALVARLRGGAGSALAGVALAWVASLLALAAVLALGPLHLTLLPWPGRPGQSLLGLYADRLAACLLVLVTTVSLATHAYARRAMRGEPGQRAFFSRLPAATAFVAAVLLSDNLLMLFFFWVLKGLTLGGLIAHYRQEPAARAAGRAKLTADLVGDAAFALALLLAWHLYGTLSLPGVLAQAAPAAARNPGAAVAVALLLLLAAMAKTALVPFQAWLPLTVEAPTPVSALMHAGLINAGGFLLARLSPVFAAAPAVLALTAVVGALTLLYGTTTMLTRPDVKGQLAHSTMGQMGFMALEAGLGAFALAMLHLVAHGFYKALLFLRSGEAVKALEESPPAEPPAPPTRVTLLAGLLLPGAVLAVAARLAAPRGGTALLWLFAGLSVAQGVVTALRGERPAARVAALLAGLAVYLAAAAGVARFLAPSLPVSPHVPAGLLIGLAGVIAALGLAALGGLPRGPLEEWLYVLSLRGFCLEELGAALRRRGRQAPARPIGGEAGAERAAEALRAAAAVVAPLWPLPAFVASNPLAGLEHLPFERALRVAAGLRGGTGLRPAAQWLAEYRRGRIADADLERALADALPDSEPGLLPALRTWLLQEAEGMAGDVAVAADAGIPLLWETEPLCAAASRVRGCDLGAEVDRQAALWLAAFLDGGQAAWRMPGRERGLLPCWRVLAQRDPALRLIGGRGALGRLRDLPRDPAAAMAALLSAMGVPAARWPAYLARHLAAAPGFAGLVRHRQEHPDDPAQRQAPVDLASLLVLRLFYEAELVGTPAGGGTAWAALAAGGSPAAPLSGAEPAAERLLDHLATTGVAEAGRWAAELAARADAPWRDGVWLAAAEHAYRRDLLSRLGTAAPGGGEPVAAQVLFCIDVRSEGLRRELEAEGPFATHGVAGFFGVAARYRPLGAERPLELCPGPLRPAYTLAETVRPGAEAAARRAGVWLSERRAWRELEHTLRERLLTPFSLVEAVGLASAVPLLLETISPGLWRRLLEGRDRLVAPTPATLPGLAPLPGEEEDWPGIAAEERVALAAGLLRGIGLTSGFARVIALLGHGSEAANNPHAAALHCGACGGRPGGVSARLAAALLNDAQVRAGLAAQGIALPADTLAVAGWHNTVTDEVSFLDLEQVPAGHRPDLHRLAAALAAAGARQAARRARTLPGAPAPAALRRRAQDWAEQRPEWGLAGAAAFVCGRRALTAGADLDGRVFLHSYDPEADADGAVLSGIMAGPLVVAQWIGMQYYFSSVDNARFGSGTKLRHSVVGGLGVQSGRGGDLQAGLPLQSLGDGTCSRHEPLRLLAVLEAPRGRVEAALGRQAHVAALVAGGWITLLALDPAGGAAWRRRPGGGWEAA